MMASTVGHAPPWVNEGLAELYQTFEIANGGRTALIGKPSRDNLVLLQASSQLMPVSDSIAVRNDSPLYNEGDRRGLFYAESWALVHYLTFGAPARSVQLRAYLTAIGRGDWPDEAFSNAFGVDTRALDVELRQYIRSYQFRALRVEFDERVSSGRLTPAQLLADDDAAGYLGDSARAKRASGRRARPPSEDDHRESRSGPRTERVGHARTARGQRRRCVRAPRERGEFASGRCRDPECIRACVDTPGRSRCGRRRRALSKSAHRPGARPRDRAGQCVDDGDTRRSGKWPAARIRPRPWI
ncbi:MAG: DUF1570 domain-containing protein [Vicinamibacterales bacterium]